MEIHFPSGHCPVFVGMPTIISESIQAGSGGVHDPIIFVTLANSALGGKDGGLGKGGQQVGLDTYKCTNRI